MKKLIVLLVIFLFLLGVAIALLHSNFAKNLARDALANALKESGFTIEIGSLSGTIPQGVYLKEVRVYSEDLSIFVDSAEAHLSLLGLFRNRLLFTEVKADQIRWEKRPRQEIEMTKVVSPRQGFGVSLEVEHFELTQVEIPDYFPVDFKGSLSLGKKKKWLYLDASATSPDLPKSEGRILAQIDKKGLLRVKGSLDLISSSSKLPLPGETHIQFFARGPWQGIIYGKATGSFIPDPDLLPSFLQSDFNAFWQMAARFQWLQNGSWEISRFSASAGQSKIVGSARGDKSLANAALQVDANLFQGRAEIEKTQTNRYQIKLYANDWEGQAELLWQPYLQIENGFLQYRSVRLDGSLALQNHIWTGSIRGAIDNLNDVLPYSYGSAQLQTRWLPGEEGEQTVQLAANALGVHYKGSFFERVEIESMGAYQNKTWQCLIQKLSGSSHGHPIQLIAPTTLAFGNGSLRLDALDLALENARVHLQIDHSPEADRIDLSCTQFPLDILSQNPLDVPILGKMDCKIQFQRTGADVSGTIDAAISSLATVSPDETLPSFALGTFTGSLKQDRLALQGNLRIGTTPLLQLDFSLPLSVQIWPPDAQWIYENDASGHLMFDGNMEEILDFFNLGMHRIAGDLHLDWTLANTLKNPSWKGKVRIEQGSYENYITGTQLVDLSVSGDIKRDELQISMTAQDKNRKGTVSASGTIQLLPAQAFPFQFLVDLRHLQAVQVDLVSAEIEGKIEIAGDITGALASGEIEVIQSDLHIPSHIPRALPDLVVVYKNPSHPINPSPPVEPHPYPLALNLHVKAPERIFIGGRGLESEWKGDFDLGGTYTSMTAKGKLELIKGRFVFSGRSFQLTDGALVFRGREREMPLIDLAGSMQIKDVSITARLKGPLNNPQITLQSVPPLPMGTIMAYMLFGQDLSGINSFQALQLANSLASIAGEGPSVLENTRRALGVDRLEIVSVPDTDDELSETIAVQVGKYVSEGVLISFTQGAEDAATNIGVEIEMKHGLIIQLESDQRQEQGKFTFKWNRNF